MVQGAWHFAGKHLNFERRLWQQSRFQMKETSSFIRHFFRESEMTSYSGRDIFTVLYWMWCLQSCGVWTCCVYFWKLLDSTCFFIGLYKVIPRIFFIVIILKFCVVYVEGRVFIISITFPCYDKWQVFQEEICLPALGQIADSLNDSPSFKCIMR